MRACVFVSMSACACGGGDGGGSRGGGGSMGCVFMREKKERKGSSAESVRPKSQRRPC